jgi:hypothetical protein
MNFDLDPSAALSAIIESLEDAGRRLSEEQFISIANKIEDGMPGVIQVLAQGTVETWRGMARDRGGWGEKYAKAIKSEVSGNAAEIFVDEDVMDKTSNKPLIMFAKMIEEGVKSWSIKDALLASDKAKIGPSGIKYIIVPFPVAAPRHASAGQGRSHFGGREMTAEMYKIVKSGGKITEGTLKSGDRDIDISGLSKYNTRQLHSQYGIFRCVSEKSQGWQYPGKGPDPVYPEVLEYVNKQVRDVVAAFCKAIVKEFDK